MGEVIKYSDFRNFIKEAEAFIETNPMLYYFLKETLARIIKGKEKVHKFFKITGDDNLIMALLTTEVCLIYDDKFNKDYIPLLSRELEFDKFIRYQFAGSKATIDALFRLHGKDYELQKHRVIYKCTAVANNFIPSPGQMQMGDIRRLNELAVLSSGFSRDYYGERDSIEEGINRIIVGIQSDSIYQWVDNGRVCSIAQSLNEDYDFPVIGHFYTHPTYRNKGYGASITYELTKGLLGVGHEFIMLSTNAFTPSSNRVFEKVGYLNVGEYLLAYKNGK